MTTDWSRRTAGLLLALGAAVAFTGCDDDDTDPAPDPDAGISLALTMPTPAQGATAVAPLGTTLSWSAAPAADGYRVFLDTDYTAVLANRDGALLGPTNGTDVDAGALQKGTLYFWRVEAELAGETFDSAVWSFTTQVGEGPATPLNPSPANGAVDVAAGGELGWSESARATGYRVYFGDDPTPVAGGAAEALIGEPATPGVAAPADLALDTTYYWRVVAVGEDGETSSPLWRFETSPTPPPPERPDAATAPMPGSGAADVALDVQLGWTAGDRAESFRVYFGDDPTAVSAGGNTLIGETDETAIAAPGPLEVGRTYFWRVVSLNAGGATSTALWSFDTIGPSPPGAVSDPTPADGAADVAVDTDLDWAPAERAERYRVWLSAELSEVIGRRGVPVGEADAPGIEVDALMAGTTYYWQVDAIGAEGITRGPVWRFDTAEVALAPPGDFGHTAPADRATDVAVDATLEWQAAAGADRYAVYLSTSLADVVVGSEGAFRGEVEATRWPVDADLDEATMYFWRVEAINDDGRTTAVVWSFTTTLPALPESVTDPVPANLADEVEIDPELAWGGGDGADSFDVYFGQDPLAVQIADPGSDVFAGNVVDRAWAPGELGFDETWYWRVDARNVAGVTRGMVWAFTTDSQTRPPVFRGVSRAMVLGDMLRVDWAPGFDDDDAAEDLTYSVYVWAADGAPSWDEPIAVALGATSVMLGRVELGDLLDAPLAVAVRGMDDEGQSRLNTVELVVPPTAGLPRFYVAEGADGDGSADAPAGDLGTALAAAADGGVILVGGGRFEVDGAVIPAGDAPIVIAGGFDWDAVAPGAADGETLAAWDPDATISTLWRDETPAPAVGGELPVEPELPPQTPMLTMDGGRWLMLAGLSIEDPDNYTLAAQDPTLVVTACRFTQLDDVDPESGRLFGEGAIVWGSAGAGTITGWFVGNDLDDTEALVRWGDVVARLHVSNNRLRDVEDELLIDDVVQEADADGNIQTIDYDWRVPAGGTLLIHQEANVGLRVEGMIEARLDPEDAANGGAVDVRIRANDLRGIDNDCWELDDVGDFGAGGSATFDIRDNIVLGVSSEFVELDIGPDTEPDADGNTYTDTSDGPITVVAEDNRFLHGNGDGFYFARANPGDHTLSFTLRRNLITHLESEGVELRTSTSSNGPVLVGGRLELIAEDNISEGVDGTFDVSLGALVGGAYDLQFRRNRLDNDHDYGHRITWNAYESGQVVPDDATTDRSMVVEDTFYNGEDQLIDMDVDVLAGDTQLIVERNEVRGSRQGVDLDMYDPYEQGELGEDGQPAWPIAGGSTRLVFRDNHFISDEDVFELTLRSFQQTAELHIEGNYGISTDDYGIDATVYDFTRVVIDNNELESYDDKAIELDIAYRAGQPIETDLFVFHNRLYRSDDENMRLSTFYENIDDALGQDYGRANVWIAGNDLYGNTEQNGLQSEVTAGSIMLVERNLFGYNDVDSEDAWEVDCEGNGRLSVRGRNNILAYGAGAGIDSRDCGGVYTNNTIAYNNRDNTSDYGVGSQPNNGCNQDEGPCFDQTLWHSNIIAFSANRDLNPDVGFQVPYSLITENPYAELPGPGVIEADPLFLFCDEIDDLECFALDPRSPTFDAGHPGADWSDRDGTRNDLGAWGGPWAGWIGWQGEPQPVPLALVGARPLGDLATGEALVPVDSTVTAIFNVDLDPATADGALSVLDGGGAAVAGAWAVDRNRAVFTPAAAFAPGETYRLRMGDSLRGEDAEAPWAPDWIDFTTAVEPVAGVEGEDPQAVAGPAFSVTGDLTGEADVSDVFTLPVQAGDRLQLTVFNDRVAALDAASAADMAIRVWDEAGEVILDADQDMMESRTGVAYDPYVDHIVLADGVVRVEVYIEETVGEPAPITYRLDGTLRPL